MRLWLIGFVVCAMAACDKSDGKTPPVPKAGEAVAAPGTVAPNAPPAGSATPTEAAPTAPVAPAPPPAPPAPVAWKLDDKIQGKWSDGRWYNGKISAVNDDGTWNIKYDDGDVSNHFAKDRIRARGAGGSSHASGGGGGTNNNAPCPGPGITRRCSGVCVNLQDDNNNCGTCGNHCPSGKHCDGHLFCRDANGDL